VDAVAGQNALSAVSRLLDQLGLPLVTDRSVADVASRLSEKFADRSETPLDRTMVETIERYLSIEGTVSNVPAQLKALKGGKTFAGAIDWFERRIAALEDQGLNPKRFQFNAGFGRELEYYTGLVFQVDVEARNQPVTVAGGGRYDDLLSDLGAVVKIPAVGCAIHTERVKAVLP
jgi:ATP phosphoribosyltransferase regulatory subunit